MPSECGRFKLEWFEREREVFLELRLARVQIMLCGRLTMVVFINARLTNDA